jgi:hypothetical protein
MLGGLLGVAVFSLLGLMAASPRPVAHGQEPEATAPGAMPTPPPQGGKRPAHEGGVGMPHRHSSAARLANVEEVRKQLGLAPAYDNLPAIENMKVAVLDHGFDGINSTRRYLPEDTVVVEHYDPEFVRRFHVGDPDYRKSFAPLNAHGRMMAQIIWGVTGFHPRGPKFYLLNANGPTMLGRAVRYAIEAKVDIILFSSTFEGGGNGDGRGPINRVVADALAADIIWINAAGNFGGHVYNGPVNVLPSGYLWLGHGSDETALRFRNLLDENTVTITLTWNDYREQEDAGTDKDLDIYVEDRFGQVVGSSEKKQVVGESRPGLGDAPEESRNPRERIVLTDLAADGDHDYFIRIKAKGGKFTADDRVRVLITSSREGFLDPKTGAPTEALQFLDASRKGEIYPPADNPMVLTIGDIHPESAVGPTADHRRKPDILLEDSRAAFTNGDLTSGASNAAAYFAGVVTLLKAAEPGLRTRHLLWFTHHDKSTRVSTTPPSAAATDTAPRESQGLSAALTARRRQFYAGSPAAIPSARDPLRIRAGNLELVLPRRSSSTARAVPARDPQALNPQAQGTVARQPELLRPPHKAAETQPQASQLVWRTPTREHLAEVVREKGPKE